MCIRDRADTDVDAADLHLILQPAVRQKEKFYSGNLAVIRSDACTGCGPVSYTHLDVYKRQVSGLRPDRPAVL